MAAAVSDARPALTAGKIKKTELDSLKLLQNPDLLAEISKQKKDQIIVGFAAEESKNLLSEGHRKLKEKKLDLIYANDIRQGEIFGSDETSGYLIDLNGETVVKPTSKANLAKLLLDMVAKRLDSANV